MSSGGAKRGRNSEEAEAEEDRKKQKKVDAMRSAMRHATPGSSHVMTRLDRDSRVGGAARWTEEVPRSLYASATRRVVQQSSWETIVIEVLTRPPSASSNQKNLLLSRLCRGRSDVYINCSRRKINHSFLHPSSSLHGRPHAPECWNTDSLPAHASIMTLAAP